MYFFVFFFNFEENKKNTCGYFLFFFNLGLIFYKKKYMKIRSNNVKVINIKILLIWNKIKYYRSIYIYMKSIFVKIKV